MDKPGERDWEKKQREYEVKKARAKALKLRLTCSICSEKAKLNCPCGTTQYCSTECQRIDWRDRGHRKACKKIRDERAAEAARADAPTPPPSPPREVVYGPAPRSQADEIRARIAAEHEAARALREANPEREPTSARHLRGYPIMKEMAYEVLRDDGEVCFAPEDDDQYIRRPAQASQAAPGQAAPAGVPLGLLQQLEQLPPDQKHALLQAALNQQTATTQTPAPQEPSGAPDGAPLPPS
ncbi:hypothetical protein JL721_11514 [Aureococcus anophagefferens]|nr:hypothetical protein JL721_11514 [Aureococcus anophagefferens]